MFCLHRNNCIYTVCLKLVQNVCTYIIQMHFFFKFFNWSRLVELPSSDEVKMFHTELEIFKINLKFHAERIQHKY